MRRDRAAVEASTVMHGADTGDPMAGPSPVGTRGTPALVESISSRTTKLRSEHAGPEASGPLTLP